MKKSIIIFSTAAAIALVLTLFMYYPNRSAVSQNTASSSLAPIKEVGIDLEYPADFADNRILMGASHNVFVGKVMAQIGSQERGIGPETQFSVVPILNIKGHLSGAVIVDQAGGVLNGVSYYIEGGALLLKPGATYLLATRYNPQEKWYTLNPSRSGSQFIINDPDADVATLSTIAQNDIRVKALEAAYPNEILLNADVRNNNALNSYKSAHPSL